MAASKKEQQLRYSLAHNKPQQDRQWKQIRYKYNQFATLQPSLYSIAA